MAKLGLKIWILLVALFLALLAISPWHAFDSGVVIKSVDKNSTAFEEGLRSGMIITQINDNAIKNSQDYTTVISNIFQNVSDEIKLTIETDQGEFIVYANTLEITTDNIPKTKIKTGLDLSGGARALIKPLNVSLSDSEVSDLVSITSQRFNVYGLSDVTVRPVKDLQGNNFMLIEIAGATPSDLKELVGKQGKFEAKIGNETIFVGGKKDITSVCRNDQTCSRIESCSAQSDGTYACRFSFVIYLSEEAANRHAEITGKLKVNNTESGRYLEKQLDLVVDENIADSLYISEDLKGKVTTQISVSGSGVGKTQQEAVAAANENMKKLQTILITGSLPYKLEIVKLDTISPVLGKEFLKNILILAVSVFAIVSIILFIKYRKIKITLSVILTMFSEAFITLGIAALIGWNLDAPGIAGIIAGMGTGVNDQIVIIDEAVTETNRRSLKERIKGAIMIILGAFFTIIAAMLPLFWAGAGLLRGFALTTILSVSVGILITRPAFAEILRRIETK